MLFREKEICLQPINLESPCSHFAVFFSPQKTIIFINKGKIITSTSVIKEKNELVVKTIQRLVISRGKLVIPEPILKQGCRVPGNLGEQEKV